jgi:hypothetical protein
MPEQDHQWIFFAEVDHLLDGTEPMAETPVRPFQQGDWITITTRKDLSRSRSTSSTRKAIRW